MPLTESYLNTAQEDFMMDFRKIFDSNVAPKDFDKWRFRYCDALFADVIAYAKLDGKKTVLEIGPGTGQATEPILKTGCSYLAVELGENFTQDMKAKFHFYPNFQIVNADFETYDFGKDRFDLVFSAATIQWIPEKIAFPKTYELLKKGGALAMFMTHTDYRSTNEALYQKIQEVYAEYFKPSQPYDLHLNYQNVTNYGFTDFERREYYETIEYSADEYVSHISIYAPHMTLQEPYKSKFFTGVRDAVLSFDDKITLKNTIILYLTRKP
jgi:trans-aconitate methyltransferase